MASKSRQEAQLITLSRPDSHLIPLTANNRGHYVTTSAGKFIISLKGVFQIVRGQAVFGGKLTESDVIFSRFVYIGTVYPDGSSLPFIPVANAEIKKFENGSINGHRRNNVYYYGLGTDASDNPKLNCFYVDLILSRSMWLELIHRFRSTLTSFTRFDIQHEGMKHEDQRTHGVKIEDEERCAIRCNVNADREVSVFLNGIWFTKGIKQALELNKVLLGNVFLMPKYTRTPGSGIGKLSFEIYGMWLTDNVEELFGPFGWQKVIY